MQVFTCHRCGEAYDELSKLHAHKHSHQSIYPEQNGDGDDSIEVKQEPGQDSEYKPPTEDGLAKFSLGPQPSNDDEPTPPKKAKLKSTGGFEFETLNDNLVNGAGDMSIDEDKAMEGLIRNALTEANKKDQKRMKWVSSRSDRTPTPPPMMNALSGTATSAEGTKMFIVSSDLAHIQPKPAPKKDADHGRLESLLRSNLPLNNLGNLGLFQQIQLMPSANAQLLAQDLKMTAMNATNGNSSTDTLMYLNQSAESPANSSQDSSELQIKQEPRDPDEVTEEETGGQFQQSLPKIKKLLGPASYKAAMQKKLLMKAQKLQEQCQGQVTETEGQKSKPETSSLAENSNTMVSLLSKPLATSLPNYFQTSNHFVATTMPVLQAQAGAGMSTLTTVPSVQARPAVTQKKVAPQPNVMTRCEHCCIWFEDYTMSLLHNSLHSADETDPFTCRKCLKRLGNRLEFTAHLVWHLEPNMDV